MRALKGRLIQAIAISLAAPGAWSAVRADSLSIVTPDQKVVVTERDLRCVSLEKDGLKRTVLDCGFTTEGQKRISEATRKHLGKKLEVRICGKTHAHLRVVAPIPGERVTIGQILPWEQRCLEKVIRSKDLKSCNFQTTPEDAPIPQ